MDPDVTSREMQPEPAPTDIAAPSGINIVGIGASAGGIHALQGFFANTPADSNMAFVVILHLPPNMESNVAEILQHTTDIPVMQVTEPTQVEPNHVYVIPPNKHLSMKDGTIQLQDPDGERVRRAPVDLFFRTLADSHGRNAAAVVLSGSGADGTVGVQRIKENGGAVLAQDPQEAEFDAMPRNVIATGLVDFILPVADMPAALIEYWRTAETVQLPIETSPHDTDAEALRDIFSVLRSRTGHDFSQYKRPTLLRRIGRRMQVNGVVNLLDYLQALRTKPEEVQALLRDLLISVTNFFRDPDVWHALAAIIPNLFAHKEPGDQVRVWVPACATGEEAYTVAMLLYEHASTLESAPSIQIFATDIDENAINTARVALYPETIAADVSPERIERFFMPEQGRYRIRKEICDLVLFAPHNLVRDPPFSKLDLITCRNLLIYLNREVQEQVLQLFHFVLLPDGYLLLGASESTDSVIGLFTPIDKGSRLFQRRTAPISPLVNIPSLPLVRPARPTLMGGQNGAEGQAQSFAELDLHALARYGPPRVIINEDYDIVHLAQGAGRFLTPADGELSPNLIRMVHPDLRLELRTALFTAMQRQENTETHWQRVEIDGAPRLVHVRVQPIREPEWATGYMLVLFNDMDDTGNVIRNTTAATEPILQQMEAELQRTKEQLRTTVEQYETAVEEYKAANEELQAINEELRAATEELETSKEELQSVNEELLTVNQELKHKVDEISQSNNDLQNLMSSTEIGTIFVDRDLCVRRYTPSAQSIFNLIPADIGRPLAHVTHKLAYEQLIHDAASVLETLSRVEREVPSEDGRWFIARLLPYRTIAHSIEGVTLTFVDITERRLAEQEMRESAEQFRALVQISAQIVWTTDAAGQVVEDSPSWRAFTGQTFDEWKGNGWLDAVHPDDQAHAAEQWQQAVASGTPVKTVFRLHHVSGEWRWTNVRAVPLRDRDGAIRGWVGMNADITEQKQAEEALRASEERLQQAIAIETVGTIFFKVDGSITGCNNAFLTMSGYSRADLENGLVRWDTQTPPEWMPQSLHAIDEFLTLGRTTPYEKEYIRKDGSRWWGLFAATRINAEEGVEFIIDITEQKQAEAELRKARDELEIRVQERTTELKQANARLQELLRSLMTAQEDERSRISRELHDQLGQQLSALRLNLAALADQSQAESPFTERVERVQEIAAMLDRDVDQLAYDLRPSGLDDLGLHVALQQHVDEWTVHHHMPIELQIIDDHDQTLPQEIETVIYRVVQEALTNVAKHAHAEHVSVILEHRPKEVRLIVEDDGDGFEVDAPQNANDGSHRLGLSGMHERVELVGGTITIESEPGSGTSLYVRIPLLSSEESSHGTQAEYLSGR